MAQTGENTAQTSDIVIMMNNQPIIVITTPNEPNALPFAFTVAGKKERRGGGRAAEHEGGQQRAGQQGAQADPSMQQEAWHPEPEDRGPDEPDR